MFVLKILSNVYFEKIAKLLTSFIELVFFFGATKVINFIEISNQWYKLISRLKILQTKKTMFSVNLSTINK